MLSRRKRIWITIVLTSFIIFPLAFVLTHPRGRATLRLTSGFKQSEQDARIYCEQDAGELADQIADALPEAIARVEKCQTRAFKKGFRVYVCGSHESFSRHINQPPSDPVRGIAFMWDVWISPLAFSFYGKDTHRETLIHELSHLHLGQHLGWWRRTKNVPVWFVEGLADWVAGTGDEIVSRREAREGFISRRHFVPDDKGKLPLPKVAKDYGVSWPMLHMQSRMFVEYLRERDEDSFKRFVAAIVDGDHFDVAFTEHIGSSLEVVWREFLNSLRDEAGVSG